MLRSGRHDATMEYRKNCGFSYSQFSIFDSMSLCQPHVAQVLIDIMAGTDLPALQPRAVRHDALPPEERKLIGLLSDDPFLHLPKKRQAVFQIKHTALALVHVIEAGIFITRIMCRTRIAAQIFEQIEIRFFNECAIEIAARAEISLPQIVEIRSALERRVRDIKTDFAPLID